MASNERLPYPEKIHVTRFSRISRKKGIRPDDQQVVRRMPLFMNYSNPRK